MNARETRRRAALDELVDSVALDEFRAAHGDPRFAEVVIVAAAYHEIDNIGRVVEALPAELCGKPVAFVVVVDGEEDGTAELVRKSGHYAVVCPVNRGQGAALRLGYRVATEHGARFIVTADADGQTDPGDLAVVLGPVLEGEADLVTGSRRLGRTESADVVRNFGIVFFSLLITRLTGTKVTDVANPIRAMRADLPERLTLAEPQYQSSELLIGAVMRGARFSERPVTMLARTSGHSKKGGNLVYGYRFSRVVLRTWWRERRSRRR
ncbi:MAG: glycosyltransferase family 2 protein [Acidimicrobiales bacterium]|jgi:glycosyltransferase involved in cell wall biosynthesis